MDIEVDRLKKNKKKYIEFSEALENFRRNLVWRACHAFLDHQDFDSSPLWLSERLGISVEEAAEALEGLEVLGLLQIDEGGSIVKKKIQFLIPASELGVETEIQSHVNLAEGVLNRINPESPNVFADYVVSTNRFLVAELFEKCRKNLDDFLKSSETCTKDDVYAITFSAVGLTTQREDT